MSLKLINTAMLASVEAGVNRLIALDPESQGRLAGLRDTCLKVECTFPPCKLFVVVGDHELHLAAERQEEPDAAIRGSAAALLGLLRSEERIHSLYGRNVEVRGSMEKVQALQKILTGYRIDWEYHLSRLIGDVPTQAVSDTLHAGRDFASHSYHSLLRDADEYIHEEKKLLPGRHELEEFYNDVDKLRLRVDRLAARVANLQNRQ